MKKDKTSFIRIATILIVWIVVCFIAGSLYASKKTKGNTKQSNETVEQSEKDVSQVEEVNANENVEYVYKVDPEDVSMVDLKKGEFNNGIIQFKFDPNNWIKMNNIDGNAYPIELERQQGSYVLKFTILEIIKGVHLDVDHHVAPLMESIYQVPSGNMLAWSNMSYNDYVGVSSGYLMNSMSDKVPEYNRTYAFVDGKARYTIVIGFTVSGKYGMDMQAINQQEFDEDTCTYYVEKEYFPDIEVKVCE